MTYGAGFLAGGSFPARSLKRIVAVHAILVSPNTNRCPGFDLKFLQNMLHVFLHGARAAPENFSDLAVAFAGCDPFHDFELALGQGAWLGERASSGACFGWSAVPGGHGKIASSGRQRLRPYA